MEENYSEVDNFYSNKSVFITGGTGFVGQVLIEKLLYSCPGINKIYIMMRPKKHMAPAERLEEFTESELFSRIKSERPEVLHKIELIEGDLTLPNLGLSVKCEDILIKNVSVVFHVAATIRFDEPIRTALTVNVEGTLQLLELSKRFTNIEAFVHVSTAYCNLTRSYIEEEVYKPTMPLNEVYQYIKEHDSDEDVRALLAGHLNTYTFTKGLTEYDVLRNRGSCSVAIVRPSIVLSIDKEPLPGWLNSWNGPTALLYQAAKGYYRCQLGDGSNVADIIPVDYVSNMAIVAAAACKKSRELTVYNCCSGSRNPVTWDQVAGHFIDTAVKIGLNELPRPRLGFFKSQLVTDLATFFLLTLPCFLADCWRRLLGKPPKYLKMSKQIRKLEGIVHYFSANQWAFEGRNARALHAGLSPADRKRFYCDPAELHWGAYLEGYCRGVRKYLVKHDEGL